MLQTIENTDIYTIDGQYLKKELASIHLIRQNDRLAIVDTGTQYSLPEVTAVIDAIGLTMAHVDYVILTHIHLDHAGGASALMNVCKNAKLVVHSKGARHMQDPSKLIAGTIAVYGEARFQELYGDIEGISAERMIIPNDGDTLHLEDRPLMFIDSPGHAFHHHCVFDPNTNSVFAGDALGVGYRALQSSAHSFVVPSTSPVQFNPVAMHASIDKVMSYKPETAYLTHFGPITPSKRVIAGLHEQIDDLVLMTEQAFINNNESEVETKLTHAVSEYLIQRCMNEIPELDHSIVEEWLQFDAQLNAQGLMIWWQYQQRAAG